MSNSPKTSKTGSSQTPKLSYLERCTAVYENANFKVPLSDDESIPITTDSESSSHQESSGRKNCPTLENSIPQMMASLPYFRPPISQNPVVSVLNSFENYLNPLSHWLQQTSEDLDNDDLYFLDQQVSLCLEYARKTTVRYSNSTQPNWHPFQRPSNFRQDSCTQTNKAKLFKRDFQTKEDLKIDKLSNMMAELTKRLDKSEGSASKKGGKTVTFDGSVGPAEEDFV